MGRRGKQALHLARRIAGILLVGLAASADGASVKILDMNIYSYNDPALPDSRYAALVRIVQAIDPDILLFQEATNPNGRSAFAAQFAARYPYSFLGSPTSDNPRNQILSAYPLANTHQIFTADTPDGIFERPTIRADVDIFPLVPGTELRVYSAHHKSGSASRDNVLRLNQATDDAADIATFVASNPAARVWYAGDLNSEVGGAPLNKLLEPQTSLIRLTILDPNNSSPMTRPESGKVIDHILYSGTLGGEILSSFIFNTRTYSPPSAIPSPALATDSASSVGSDNNTLTASDHLTLVAVLNIPEGPPSEPVRLNEVYVDQAGTDTVEFVELVGPPGASLAGLSVLVIEGDSESNTGAVDRLWSLGTSIIPPNGLFVLGSDAVVRRDLPTGASIENGTETILLVRNPTFGQGGDIDTNDDGIADGPIGTIEDSVALRDNGASDRVYVGAPIVGPVGSAVPPGIARVPDAVGAWVALSDQLNGSDGKKPASPGLSNSPGDFDRDGDVDQADFDLFHAGYSGPDEPSADGRTDLDDDGDTDQVDFGLFQIRLNAP